MNDVISTVSCKIVIDIDQNGHWHININDKDIIDPDRFMIDLRGDGKPPSYTLELCSVIPQNP